MSIFAGMSRDQLQAALTAAQTALIEIMSGKRAVALSYTQGDGAKSVTRQMSTTAECTALIVQLQIALGVYPCRRRARIFYR